MTICNTLCAGCSHVIDCASYGKPVACVCVRCGKLIGCQFDSQATALDTLRTVESKRVLAPGETFPRCLDIPGGRDGARFWLCASCREAAADHEEAAWAQVEARAVNPEDIED